VRQWCLAVARRCAAAEEAEDIAQDALVRAWRSRGSCRAPEQPWSWLATITHREGAPRHSRIPAPVPAGSDLPEPHALDAAIEGAPDRLTLWPAVAALGERDRQIVLLHYGHDMTVEGVARTLGVPTGTVKVTLSRIRDKLRRGLSR